MDLLRALGGVCLGLLIAAGAGLLLGFSVIGSAWLWIAVALLLTMVAYLLFGSTGQPFYKGGLIIGLCVGGLLVGLCFNALRNI